MSEGLQLHQSLLNSVSPRLVSKDKINDLMSDIRDLTVQINKVGEDFCIAVYPDTWSHFNTFTAPSPRLTDAEKGANGGSGEAHSHPCGFTSSRGIRGSGSSTPDSGAAADFWPRHGLLPQEPGPEQRRGDRELTNPVILT